MSDRKSDRTIYRGKEIGSVEALSEKEQQKARKNIPPPPPWRTFSDDSASSRGLRYVPQRESILQGVNAAMILRRPVLVEGRPGSGKTSLAHAVALELGLPGPFRWSITSRSDLKEGLYQYDALERLNAISRKRQILGEAGGEIKETDIGQYFRLGPAGMAIAVSREKRPAVLLIDEIDKSDIDLPSDLLHLFEEGWFPIPELQRLKQDAPVEVLPSRSSGVGDWADPRTSERIKITHGHVSCQEEFPLVIMTSNGEREFPPAFLRRCVHVECHPPQNQKEFRELVRRRFGELDEQFEKQIDQLIDEYLKRTEHSLQAPDQLLNAVKLLVEGTDLMNAEFEQLRDGVFQSLGNIE